MQRADRHFFVEPSSDGQVTIPTDFVPFVSNSLTSTVKQPSKRVHSTSSGTTTAPTPTQLPPTPILTRQMFSLPNSYTTNSSSSAT